MPSAATSRSPCVSRAVGETSRVTFRLSCATPTSALPKLILRKRQRVLERTIENRPRAQDAGYRVFAHDAPRRIEAAPGDRCDTDRFVDLDADAPHDCEHLIVGADAGAAAREIVTDALENLHRPPRRPQHVRREQSAQRTADDQSPPLPQTPAPRMLRPVHVVCAGR